MRYRFLIGNRAKRGSLSKIWFYPSAKRCIAEFSLILLPHVFGALHTRAIAIDLVKKSDTNKQLLKGCLFVSDFFAKQLFSELFNPIVVLSQLRHKNQRKHSSLKP
jgi:hypothetical protein